MALRKITVGVFTEIDNDFVSALLELEPAFKDHIISLNASTTTEWSKVEIIAGSPGAVRNIISYCDNLKWIQSIWSGVELLLPHLPSQCLLSSMKGIFGQAVAEYVVGWVLALARSIPQRSIARDWDECSDSCVASQRVGIMGTGDIGSAVAKKLAPFVEKVIGLNSDGHECVGFASCYPIEAISDFALDLDGLVSVLPDTPRTRNLVNDNLLDLLAPKAWIINVGRGTTIVDKDLLAALDSKHLSAAVLDVFRTEPLPKDDPYWRHSQVFVTSHSAAPTDPAKAALCFVENYIRYINGETVRYLVDRGRGY